MPTHIIRSQYIIVWLYLALFVTMTARNWNNPRGVIWSDAEGYYAYLPAVFIVGDLHQMPAESVQHQKNAAGENLDKYTCGVALFEMPFFLAARAFCLIMNQEPNQPFSMHYGRAVAVAGYTIGFLGLFFLDRALRRRFSDWARIMTVIAVFAGTNLHYYMTRDGGMSHAYSFCLFAFVLWHTPRFYERPTLRNALFLGIALGWITLIRPTNAIAALFVLAYDCTSLTAIADRLKWWLQAPKYLLTALVGAVLIVSPQLYYWYTMTGSVIRYSYTNERFIYWSQPKIAAVLFDPQNGLFLYSPMALLMVAGMWIGRRQMRTQTWALAPIFIISTYIFASWWAWWFGGAFGHRCYVELFAFLALPLAALIEQMLAAKPVPRTIFIAIWAFLCYYGVKMSYLYTELPRPWDGPDWRWNWDKMHWIWAHLF